MQCANELFFAHFYTSPYISQMTIADRLDQAMRFARFKSQNALARASGIPQPTINRALGGKGKKGPETETLKALAAACHVNFEWLNEGIGEMARSSNANTEPGPDIRTEREYPLISWVEAGTWTEICDNFEPGDAEEWRPCHKNLGKCGYVLRVKGQSMTVPDAVSGYTFPEGILLYVNPDQDAVPGKFVIVRRNKTHEATFKRLVLVDGDQYLEAINPDWPNRYLKLHDGDQFCGVVMHAGFDMP